MPLNSGFFDVYFFKKFNKLTGQTFGNGRAPVCLTRQAGLFAKNGGQAKPQV